MRVKAEVKRRIESADLFELAEMSEGYGVNPADRAAIEAAILDRIAEIEQLEIR